MAKKKRPLTPKQKKFVTAKVQGKSHYDAYEAAGYSTNTTKQAVRSNAQKLMNNDKIQDAIDKALEHHEATPEFAVGRLKAVAEQTDQWSAARQASMNIIELHGWNKQNKPHVTLAIKSQFFTQAREEPQEVENTAD